MTTVTPEYLAGYREGLGVASTLVASLAALMAAKGQPVPPLYDQPPEETHPCWVSSRALREALAELDAMAARRQTEEAR